MWIIPIILACAVIPNDALLCTDLQCKDPKHVNAINTYANDITEACIAAPRLVVPLTHLQSTGE